MKTISTILVWLAAAVPLATLKARGVTIAYGPYAAKEGRRANVIVSDNAGNLIQFFGS